MALESQISPPTSPRTRQQIKTSRPIPSCGRCRAAAQILDEQIDDVLLPDRHALLVMGGRHQWPGRAHLSSCRSPRCRRAARGAQEGDEGLHRHRPPSTRLPEMMCARLWPCSPDNALPPFSGDAGPAGCPVECLRLAMADFAIVRHLGHITPSLSRTPVLPPLYGVTGGTYITG